MPIRLSDLAKATRPATFDWEGETCTVTYRPSANTTQLQLAAAALQMLAKETPETDDPDEQARIGVQQAEARSDAQTEFIDAMVRLVASWEIIGEDGKALPINRQTMGMLPLPLLYAMFGAIMAAYNPNPKRVKRSPGT